MSFLKEILLEKGKKCWEANVDSWGYQIDGDFGYGFYSRSNKLKIKGPCCVNLTLKSGFDFSHEKIIWESMNIEIASLERPFDEFYKFNVRLKNYKTYGEVKLKSEQYIYEGEIDNNTLNEFAKIVKEMYETACCEWEERPKAKMGFRFL